MANYYDDPNQRLNNYANAGQSRFNDYAPAPNITTVRGNGAAPGNLIAGHDFRAQQQNYAPVQAGPVASPSRRVSSSVAGTAPLAAPVSSPGGGQWDYSVPGQPRFIGSPKTDAAQTANQRGEATRLQSFAPVTPQAPYSAVHSGTAFAELPGGHTVTREYSPGFESPGGGQNPGSYYQTVTQGPGFERKTVNAPNQSFYNVPPNPNTGQGGVGSTAQGKYITDSHGSVYDEFTGKNAGPVAPSDPRMFNHGPVGVDVPAPLPSQFRNGSVSYSGDIEDRSPLATLDKRQPSYGSRSNISDPGVTEKDAAGMNAGRAKKVEALTSQADSADANAAAGRDALGNAGLTPAQQIQRENQHNLNQRNTETNQTRKDIAAGNQKVQGGKLAQQKAKDDADNALAMKKLSESDRKEYNTTVRSLVNAQITAGTALDKIDMGKIHAKAREMHGDMFQAAAPAQGQTQGQPQTNANPVRSGTLPDGRRVHQLADGSVVDEQGTRIQ